MSARQVRCKDAAAKADGEPFRRGFIAIRSLFKKYIAPDRFPSDSGSSPRGDGGGGPLNRSATPAPFTDDLLMDKNEIKRFFREARKAK